MSDVVLYMSMSLDGFSAGPNDLPGNAFGDFALDRLDLYHLPLGDYGFGRRFGWVEDKFGMSWLLNIE